jgi:ribonucleoside-diphosphate reductase alpha chain
MQIIKLNGGKQQFLPNKILKRIKDQSKDLQVDPTKVFQECVIGIVDGMSTTDIDSLIATTAADKIIEHYDYSYLASRIIITRHSKIIDVEPKETDFLYDYKAIKSFLYKYSKRDDKGNPTELPHMMYERVIDYLGGTKEQYNLLANQKISLATPILINAGTNRKSLISCNLTTLVDDSLEGIEKTLTDIAYASKDGAGIGLHIHNLRSRHSLVSSFKGNAGGVVRFADMVQSKMRFYKQGNRAGSAALYLGIWHRDVEDFLELRLQSGEERWRTRDLFTAICIPDLFMNKLNNGEDDWYIFCPNEVEKAGHPPLHDFWGKEFNNLYQKLVSEGLGKRVSLKHIWGMILKSQVEAGLPYTFFWDNANKNNPHPHLGTCTGSNLCIEIIQKSKADYTAQCCLGSIPLHNIDLNDFEDISERSYHLTLLLNQVIDKNEWSTEAAKKAGEEQRAIAIGIGGLADYMAKHRIDFVSQDAKVFNKLLIMHIQNSARKASFDLGILFPEKKVYDTDYVNSTFVALMPTASTSVLAGMNEAFEPFQGNLFMRRIDAGEELVINKYLVQELLELDLWTPEIRNNIMVNEGSVQYIDIPDEMKQRYKTIWEHKQKDLIDLAVERQYSIDQSQSLNLYFIEPTTAKVGGALNYAWKQGLPTGSYYTKTKSKLKAPSRLAIEKVQTSSTNDKGWTYECYGCSS